MSAQVYEQHVTQGQSWLMSVFRNTNTQLITIRALTSDTGVWQVGYGGTLSPTLLPRMATAAAVQAALEDLPGMGAGNLAITGAAGGPYTVAWLQDLQFTLQAWVDVTWTFTTGFTGGIVVKNVARDLSGFLDGHLRVATPPGTVPFVVYADVTLAGTPDGDVEFIGTELFTDVSATTTATWAFATAQYDLDTVDEAGIIEEWLTGTVQLHRTVF